VLSVGPAFGLERAVDREDPTLGVEPAIVSFIAARAIVAALATEPGLLLAASVFGGIGYALFLVGGVTWVSAHVPRELAATAQGIFQGVGTSLSQVTAAAAGGAIAAIAGIDGLFMISAGLGVMGATIVALAVGRSAAERYAS